MVGRVLLIDEATQGLEEKLYALQQSNPKRLEILIGVCARLSLVDQIRDFSFVGSTQSEKEYFLYQIDRLSAYLTTTCIDVLTGEHYQPYHQWLEDSYKGEVLGDAWNQAITELSQHLTPDKTASAFVKCTKSLYEDGYKETTSIRKAFKNFVSVRDNWLKNWLLQNYVVEELNSNFEPKKSWQAMSDDEKCRNIAYYLYDLRNLYTHTVIPYQPMEYVQRSNSNLPDNYRVEGPFAIFFPPTSRDEPYRRISLPGDKRESDVVRLLVITWIRMHWLQIVTDSDSFIQKYWESRITP
jgi:hypothetical protein